MGYTTAAIAVAGLVASAVGTGISYYGQQQQAQNAQSVANYNAQIAAQNSAVNRQIAAQQAVLAQQQIARNQQLTQAQADAQRRNATVLQNNATALEQQGRAAEAQGREQARRMREDNIKKLATQRARYAKSGVTSEGSPLAVMAESAGLLELGVQDLHFQSDLEGRAYDTRAAGERYQADNERFGADFTLAADTSAFDASVARYEAAATEAGLRIQSQRDKFDYMAGSATAAGYKAASFGTLVSGAGSALDIGANAYGKTRKLY